MVADIIKGAILGADIRGSRLCRTPYFLPFHPAKIYLDNLTIYIFIINNLRVNQDNFLTLCLPIKLSRILTEY